VLIIVNRQRKWVTSGTPIQYRISAVGKGFVFAGVNTYRIDKIISVKKLIEILLIEYENTTVIGARLEE